LLLQLSTVAAAAAFYYCCCSCLLLPLQLSTIAAAAVYYCCCSCLLLLLQLSTIAAAAVYYCCCSYLPLWHGGLLTSLGGTPCSCKLPLSLPLWLQLSTYVAWWTADIFGRKTLFLQAGFQMAGALIVVAVSLKCLGEQGVWMAWYILAIICVYDM